MILVIIIPNHAKKQIEKRGITEAEVEEVIKNGDIIFEEINSRFGRKRYSKIPLGMRSLIVIWFVNKKGEEEVITAYWRQDKKWEK